MSGNWIGCSAAPEPVLIEVNGPLSFEVSVQYDRMTWSWLLAGGSMFTMRCARHFFRKTVSVVRRCTAGFPQRKSQRPATATLSGLTRGW